MSEESSSDGQSGAGREAPKESTPDAQGGSTLDAPIFTEELEKRGGMPVAAWVVAALIVVVLVGALVFLGRKRPVAAPSTLQPADAYAVSLPLTQFAMSESENLTGGKQTYLDGHVANTGGRTVTAVTVQVVFQNDMELAPQIDRVPLTLIRVKEPYIDTEPVSAEPLKPGDELTFETVPENWNQQMPEVRVIRIGVR
jgi:hypothetical protein